MAWNLSKTRIQISYCNEFHAAISKLDPKSSFLAPTWKLIGCRSVAVKQRFGCESVKYTPVASQFLCAGKFTLCEKTNKSWLIPAWSVPTLNVNERHGINGPWINVLRCKSTLNAAQQETVPFNRSSQQLGKGAMNLWNKPLEYGIPSHQPVTLYSSGSGTELWTVPRYSPVAVIQRIEPVPL